jgi:SAM-dependent methyltransferase
MTLDATQLDPREVYRRRFDADAVFRRAMWGVLCRDCFQRFIPEDAHVLEVAAGYCEFINQIRAARKIAVDINEDIRRHAGPNVEVVLAPSTRLAPVADASVDVVFMSNFLEHISKQDISLTLQECRRVLRPGGRVMILQPNIRYCAKDYWMFFDHVTPIDDRALCEVLEVTGFTVDLCRPRFLPYTTKSRLPRALWMIRLYLRLPLLHHLFGGQAFVIARR